MALCFSLSLIYACFLGVFWKYKDESSVVLLSYREDDFERV